MKMVRFEVSLALPPEADVDDVRQYILTAVRHWKGGLTGSPDPMADLNPSTVTVTRLTRRSGVLQDLQHGRGRD